MIYRNLEAVSKLASYPGGLYSLAAATISTVTATRIMALEVLKIPLSHYSLLSAYLDESNV